MQGADAGVVREPKEQWNVEAVLVQGAGGGNVRCYARVDPWRCGSPRLRVDAIVDDWRLDSVTVPPPIPKDFTANYRSGHPSEPVLCPLNASPNAERCWERPPIIRHVVDGRRVS